MNKIVKVYNKIGKKHEKKNMLTLMNIRNRANRLSEEIELKKGEEIIKMWIEKEKEKNIEDRRAQIGWKWSGKKRGKQENGKGRQNEENGEERWEWNGKRRERIEKE